jgi:hypothetical protein
VVLNVDHPDSKQKSAGSVIMPLETTTGQLLEELPVGTQGTTYCQWCNHEFDEADPIIILFTQPAGTDHWAVHRTYCTTCNPSTIASPVLDCPKLLARCRLDTHTELETQPTELVVLEPKLIDASEPVETPLAFETDENTDPDTASPSSNEVEIETLPPSLSDPATHRSEIDSSVRSEEHPSPDNDAD